MKRTKNFSRVVEDVLPGARLARVDKLSGGISAGMFVLEIERPGEAREKLVLRFPGASALSRNPAAARNEFWLLRELKAQGLPVPAPIHVDETCRILPGPFLLIQHVTGKTEFIVSELTDRV